MSRNWTWHYLPFIGVVGLAAATGAMWLGYFGLSGFIYVVVGIYDIPLALRQSAEPDRYRTISVMLHSKFPKAIDFCILVGLVAQTLAVVWVLFPDATAKQVAFPLLASGVDWGHVWWQVNGVEKRSEIHDA